MKLAPGNTFATRCADILMNRGGVASSKIFLVLDNRGQNQMKIRRIHVSVCYNLVFGKGGKGGDNAGLSGSPFTAYDRKLFHGVRSVVLIF
jgi:hypothetical protein